MKLKLKFKTVCNCFLCSSDTICCFHARQWFNHQQPPSTPVAATFAACRCYARVWKIRLAWLTFLEHMIFKGTAALAPGVFDKIENRCGMINAATSHDYTHYFSPRQHLYLEDATPLGGTAFKCSKSQRMNFVRERKWC